jgi:acetyl-CoA carboxylase carboxyl transferase alpha subunit
MVQLARRPDRPRAMDYIQRMFSPFIELHGDRLYGDDPAVVTGLARLGAESVVVIAQQKSRPEQAEIEPSTGAPASLLAESRGEITPEGFRKASRAVQLAARFRLPVISLIDTPGPRLGLEMERRGLANAIAGSITSMLRARTPSISVLIGEGGSEAAMAFGVADRVLMLQNAIYTPISPEDGAASEHRDTGRASDMARALKLTSMDCLRMGAIDAVVPEPPEGAHGSPEEAARLLRRTLMRELAELREVRVSSLVKRRHKKYRKIGEHVRNPQEAKATPAPRRRTWRSGLFRRGGGPPDERRKEERPKKVDAAGKAEKPEKPRKREKAPKPAPPSEGATGPAAGPAAIRPAKSAAKAAKRRSRLRAVLLRRRGRPAPGNTEPDAEAPKERGSSPGEG